MYMDPFETLTGQSKEKRHTIVSARIKYIINIPDEERRVKVAHDVLETIVKLPEEEKMLVYRAAADSVGELLKPRKQVLLETLRKVILKWPMNRKMEEKRVLAVAIRDLPSVKQAFIRRAYRKLLF